MRSGQPSSSSADVLKHEPVPGFRRVFLIAVTVMGLYLAVILLGSPGKVEHHGDHGSSHEEKAEESGHGTSGEPAHHP